MAIGELEATLKQPTATKSGQLQHLFFLPKIKFAREYAEAVDVLQETMEKHPALPEPLGKLKMASLVGPGMIFPRSETREFAIETFPTVVEGIIKEAKQKEPTGELVYRAAAGSDFTTKELQDLTEGTIKDEMKEIYKTTILQEYKTIIREKELKEKYEKETIKFSFPGLPDLGLGGITDFLGSLGKGAVIVAVALVGGYLLLKKK